MLWPAQSQKMGSQEKQREGGSVGQGHGRSFGGYGFYTVPLAQCQTASCWAGQWRVTICSSDNMCIKLYRTRIQVSRQLKAYCNIL